MRRFRTFLLAASTAWLALASTAFAGHAEIMMLPTRLVMQGNDRYATLVVKNTGNAAGDFNVDLVDMKMLETGMVVPLEAGEAPEHPASPLVALSPRSFTLKPDEAQTVRLMLRKPEGLATGEYRSHVRVRLVNDDAEAPAEPAASPAISVKTHLVVVIPAIVRHGETALSVGIEHPALTWDARRQPSIGMVLTREGDRSAMGDLSIAWQPPQGEPRVIKVFPGVPVYRPTARRFVSVPLDDLPPGVDLSRGRLQVRYVAQPKEGGGLLAETPPWAPASGP